MKRFLICLFSFLFIGCSIAGGAVLLSNSSYSDEYRGGDSSNSENDVTKNAPTNDDLWTDSGNYATSFAGGRGTSTSPYQIATAGQLAYLAYLINNTTSSTYRSSYYIQTANINLSAHYWDPIGNYNTTFHYFSGSYDGGGYTISGIFTISTERYQGLFGVFAYGTSRVIQRVNITNSDISGTREVGGIIAYIFRSRLRIYNCSVNSNISNNHPRYATGGIVGVVEDYSLEIENCSFSGSVSGIDNAGGIIGYFYGGAGGTVRNCNNSGEIIVNADYNTGICAGGIVGECENVVISGCWNSGEVKGADRMGGISGKGGSIVNCYNIADIDGSTSISEICRIGGIVGEIENSDDYLFNCYNTGNLIGYIVGGIVGDNYATVRNCYNFGQLSTFENGGSLGGIVGWSHSIVANCYNTGEIIGGGRINDSIGGIVALLSSGAIYNCYNAGAVSGRSGQVGGIAGEDRVSNSIYNCYYGINCTNQSVSGNDSDRTGYTLTESNAKSLSWYTTSSNWNSSYPWDFNYIWQISSGVNDGYPTLRMLTPYFITYDSNGGSGSMGNSIKIYNINITLRANSFTRTGYTFQGWATSSSGSVVYSDGATYSTNADITLYAVWRANTYTITYNANGGEGTMASSTKSYGSAITLRTNTFTREGYTFKGWATSANGSVVYADGARYTSNASITLYAVWERAVLNITIDWQLGDYENSSISLYYNQYYADESGQITSFDYDQISHAGFSFMGCYTSPNGQGNITVYPSGEFVSTTITQEDDTWYCYWVPNLSAYYDENGYWYVELGMMPQTKVTDDAIITALNGTGLTSGNNYRFGDLLLESKVYGNEEYCEYNGNWYRVEPIRWRLDYSTSQTVGFGTTEDTLAVMDTIVFVSQFSETELNENMGYSTTAVTNLLDSLSDTAYFVTEGKSMPTFGTTSLNGPAERVTSNIFVASREEITEVAGGGKIQFSDLVRDYLLANGQMPLYYTRDLGTNYNNIFCMNGNGESVQYKPQNFFGVQFSVLITEYGCIN